MGGGHAEWVEVTNRVFLGPEDRALFAVVDGEFFTVVVCVVFTH